MGLVTSLVLLSALQASPTTEKTLPDPSTIQLVGDHVVLHGGADDGLPLETMVRFVSEQTGISFSFEPLTVQAVRVHLVGNQKEHKDRLFELFQNHLRSKLMTLVPLQRGPLEEVRSFALYSMAGGADNRRPGVLKTTAIVIPWEDVSRYAGYSAVLATTSVSLQHLNGQEAVNMLQSYFTDPMTESVRAVSSSNTVIMTGLIPTLATFRVLVEAIDKPPGVGVVTEVVTLKNVAADEVQPVMAALDPVQTNSNLPTQPTISFVADARTNQLIVRGPEARVKAAVVLLAKLDVACEK